MAYKDPEYAKKYYIKNKQRIKNRQDKWRKKNSKRSEDRRMQRVYGITIEDYNIMFFKQEGKCAICGVHQSDLHKSLCIDHNHETGNVRALLCDKCNRGLGSFNDSVDLLNKAKEYLRTRGLLQ